MWGQLVEEVDFYSRVHEMMEILTASDNRNNESVEEFGFTWDEHKPVATKVAEYVGIGPEINKQYSLNLYVAY